MSHDIRWQYLSPSRDLLRFAREIGSRGPVLDAPCGFGRNAIAMAAHGATVVGIDSDLKRLEHLELNGRDLIERAPVNGKRGEIALLCGDLSQSGWSFGRDVFGAIMCVHFDPRPLLGCFRESLKTGGYLYLETFGGQGRNWLSLPRAGEIRSALVDFDLRLYREKRVGPPTSDSVTVKMLAQKLG